MGREPPVQIKKYVKELVIDRIVYIDIPLAFEIEEPALLERLAAIISASPGMLLDYTTLARDLQRNRKTISNNLFYLEKSFVIRKIYNFSKNLLTSEKKKKRFYPFSSSLGVLYGAGYGKLFETVVLQNSSFRFFYRKNAKEVDFIDVGDKGITPVEVKAENKIDKNTEISLLDFMAKFNAKKGTVITKDFEGEKTVSWFGKKARLALLPLWKWLLENKNEAHASGAR